MRVLLHWVICWRWDWGERMKKIWKAAALRVLTTALDLGNLWCKAAQWCVGLEVLQDSLGSSAAQWILPKRGFFDILKFVTSYILIDSSLHKLMNEFTCGLLYSTFTQADEASYIKYVHSQVLLSQGFASYIHAIASPPRFCLPDSSGHNVLASDAQLVWPRSRDKASPSFSKGGANALNITRSFCIMHGQGAQRSAVCREVETAKWGLTTV